MRLARISAMALLMITLVSAVACTSKPTYTHIPTPTSIPTPTHTSTSSPMYTLIPTPTSTSTSTSKPTPHSKAPDIEWQKHYSAGPGMSVQQTSDGGFIIVASPGNGGSDVYLIKTDASGNEQWNKTFGGSSDDQGYSVQQTSDGGFIVAGTTASFGAGSHDVYLIKTDASGNEQWNKTFGGSSDDQGYSVQQISDGGFIVAGTTASFGAGSRDVYLIKTDASGNEQWNKTFGGSSDDQGYSVQQTSDGGFIVAGYTRSFGAGGMYVYLIKTDASGNEMWSKTYGSSGTEMGSSVQQTSDGGFIISGRTDLVSHDDVYMVKTDSSGNEMWSKTYDDLKYTALSKSDQTSDGGFIITGFNGYVGLVRTDASGNEMWSGTFGESVEHAQQAEGRSVQQTSDGGFIITGTIWRYNGAVLYLIKVLAE